MREKFLNSHALQAEGIKPAETKVSYFRGDNPANWRSNIPAYQEVSFGEVYDHIQVNLKAYGSKVEKLFIIEKGARPEEIAVKIEGTKGLKVNEKGELEIETGIGTVRMTKPVAYQEIDGNRIDVSAGYSLQRSAVSGQLSAYGFKVGSYNKNYPLVIDPLLASTFIGGDAGDCVNAIALDSSGNVYVTGTTNGSYSTPPVNFPTTPGAYQEKFNEGGETDIFISKFNPTLTNLLASTCIGGTTPCWECGSNGDDYVHTLKIDASGNVYIGGETHARDYPTTSGAFDTTPSAWYSREGFVSKLDSSLSALLASTYINKDTFGEWSTVYSLTFASDGSIYIAGSTYGSAPVTGGYQTTSKGWEDAYVGKMDSSLTTMQAFTFIGGANSKDYANSIALDSSGNVFITGYSNSNDYPTTSGAYDTIYNGSSDAIISKFNSSLTTLLASTYLGGSVSNDYGNSLVLDSSGNVFIAGTTNSNDFPTTTGAYDTSYNGGSDIYVAKLNSNLTRLLASTLLGGYHYEELNRNGLVLDSSDNIFLAGSTGSSDFPLTADADYQTFNQGVYVYDVRDVFISKLNYTLTSLSYSTFVGGTSTDRAYAIALDSSGKIYFAGETYSSNYPATTGASTHNGNYDAFVSKLEISEKLTVSVIGPSIVNPGQEVSYLLKYKNGMKVTAENVLIQAQLPDGIYYQSSTHAGIYKDNEHVVIWKLGNLTPDTEGSVSVNLYIPWGAASRAIDLDARIDAESIPEHIIDVETYLNYTKVTKVSERYLTSGEISSLKSSDSRLNSLFTYAQNRGFAFYDTAKDISMSDGSHIRTFVFLKKNPFEILFLQNRNDFYLFLRQSDNAVELFSDKGGVEINSHDGTSKAYSTVAGAGSPAAGLKNSLSPDIDYDDPANDPLWWECVKRCMMTNMAAIPVDLTVDTVMAPFKMGWGIIKGGWHFVSGQWTEVSKDALEALPYKNLLQRFPELYSCNDDCSKDYTKYYCKGNAGDIGKAWCEGNLRFTWRCGGMNMWQFSPTVYNCMSWEKKICVHGECRERGICIGNFYGCSNKSSNIQVAHDPNAKSVDLSGNVIPGQKLNYTIEYENTGQGTAYDVFIVDTLDEDLDDSTLVMGNGGEYTSESRMVSWYIGELSPGGKGSVTFSVNVKSGLASGTEITNYAEIYFPSASEITPTNPVVNVVKAIVADPKSAETTSGTPVSITLTGHDSGSKSLTYRITTNPLYGTVAGTPPNITYTSMNEFSGQDEFYYVANNGTIDSDPAKVTVRVNPNLSDKNPPTVTSTYPEAGASNIHASTTEVSEGQYLPIITATFSEQLDSATVVAGAFTVDGITGTVSYNDQTRTAYFTLSSPLNSSTTYTARLSTGIRDKAGNHLQSEYSWQFSTVSTSNIEVALPDNADEVNFGNVPVNQSRDKVVNIISTGTSDLILGTIPSPSGTDAGEFSIVGDNCSGEALAPSENCTVKIRFTPTSTGTKNAQLNILSNDTDTPSVNVSLTGVGTTCSEWDDVIQKYQAYVQGRASWQEVIDCYTTYVQS